MNSADVGHSTKMGTQRYVSEEETLPGKDLFSTTDDVNVDNTEGVSIKYDVLVRLWSSVGGAYKDNKLVNRIRPGEKIEIKLPANTRASQIQFFWKEGGSSKWLSTEPNIAPHGIWRSLDMSWIVYEGAETTVNGGSYG